MIVVVNCSHWSMATRNQCCVAQARILGTNVLTATHSDIESNAPHSANDSPVDMPNRAAACRQWTVTVATAKCIEVS
jgi:hypothetical protein